MRILRSIIIASLITLAGSSIFIFSGLYPIGADTPHTRLVFWALETLRQHSVASAARDIVVPELSDPKLLLSGGADYNEMCADCHLKPGKSKSDLSVGLYPTPPNLTIAHEDNADGHSSHEQTFWIIKHGIKASGMPAWGLTHDDQRIWAMVAFLQRLPDLTALQYQILTARTSAANGHDQH
jgi:mono/diheme cytochrome c family protein